MRLDGRVAIITGAGSGIGRAIADKYGAAGASVIATDAMGDRAEETAAAIKGKGGKARGFKLNVCEQGDIDQVKAALSKDASMPDIIVNCAGWDKLEPFLKTTPDFWRRVVDINFMGTMAVTHAFLQPMVDAGKGGRIVNISSDAGRVGSSGETAYAGAKGAVIAFTKSLAREMARYKINVNCVCPGPTETPLLRANPDNYNEALVRAIPFRRFGEPAEIAGAVLFFASEESTYITGQILSVNGGLAMVG